jgi:outer membrane protein assembly factor BamB
VAVACRVVICGAQGGTVYALDAATGQQIWSAATGSAVRSPPAVVPWLVRAGSYQHHVSWNPEERPAPSHRRLPALF